MLLRFLRECQEQKPIPLHIIPFSYRPIFNDGLVLGISSTVGRNRYIHRFRSRLRY